MPIRPEFDEEIVEEISVNGVVDARKVGQIGYHLGARFNSSITTWGRMTAVRLTQNGFLTKVSRGRWCVTRRSELVGVPYLGDVHPDVLRKVKACLLLGAAQLDYAEPKAEGACLEFIQGLLRDLTAKAKLLDVIIEEDHRCKEGRSPSRIVAVSCLRLVGQVQG